MPRGELHDQLGRELLPIPTAETKQPDPASIYAQCKYFQEQSCLCIDAAYGIPTVALRFFNFYGPRQSLLNPYTGVIAIFASRLRAGLAPQLYEDGLQRRDFVNIYDVTQACLAAIYAQLAPGSAINIGSGEAVTIRQVAHQVARVLEASELAPFISRRFRAGEMRHCFDWPANVSRFDHLSPPEHRAFYCSLGFTLNLTRKAMKTAGFSPSVRLFEAAACGCAIASYYWNGLEAFFTPHEEIALVERTTDLLRLLSSSTPLDRRKFGERAHERVLASHSGLARARELERLIDEL